MHYKSSREKVSGQKAKQKNKQTHEWINTYPQVLCKLWKVYAAILWTSLNVLILNWAEIQIKHCFLMILFILVKYIWMLPSWGGLMGEMFTEKSIHLNKTANKSTFVTRIMIQGQTIFRLCLGMIFWQYNTTIVIYCDKTCLFPPMHLRGFTWFEVFKSSWRY